MADLYDPLMTSKAGLKLGGGETQSDGDGFPLDPAIHGRAGAPEMFSPMMGREGGGGWISDPYPHGPEHSRGVWAQRPAADPDSNHTDLTGVPYEGAVKPGDTIYRTVMGWAGDPSAEGGWKS